MNYNFSHACISAVQFRCRRHSLWQKIGESVWAPSVVHKHAFQMSNSQRIFLSESSQNDRTGRSRLSDPYQGEYCKSAARILLFHPQEGYETPIREPNGSSEARRTGERIVDNADFRHDSMRATAQEMIKCRASQAAEGPEVFDACSWPPISSS